MSGHLLEILYEQAAQADALEVYAPVTIDTATGLVVYVNEWTTRLFGYEKEEMLGMEVDLLLPETSREAHKVLREGSNENPHPRHMGDGRILFGRKKSGVVFPAQIGLGRVRKAGDKMVRTAYIVDLTIAVENAQRIAYMVRDGVSGQVEGDKS